MVVPDTIRTLFVVDFCIAFGHKFFKLPREASHNTNPSLSPLSWSAEQQRKRREESFTSSCFILLHFTSKFAPNFETSWRSTLSWLKASSCGHFLESFGGKFLVSSRVQEVNFNSCNLSIFFKNQA